MTAERILNRRIRPLLALFMACLVVSGLTAVPLETEVGVLARIVGADQAESGLWPEGLKDWIVKIREGLAETNRKYPFMAYGTDWLAFAHVVIAVSLIGPFRDPVRNIWVIEFAMIACVAVVPMALIAGAFRGIPLWWRLIDCSFGVVGIIPLWATRRYVKRLERALASG